MTGTEKFLFVLAGLGSLLLATGLLEIITGKSHSEIDARLTSLSKKLKPTTFQKNFFGFWKTHKFIMLYIGLGVLASAILLGTIHLFDLLSGIGIAEKISDFTSIPVSLLSVSAMKRLFALSLLLFLVGIHFIFDEPSEDSLPVESKRRSAQFLKALSGLIISAGAFVILSLTVYFNYNYIKINFQIFLLVELIIVQLVIFGALGFLVYFWLPRWLGWQHVSEFRDEMLYVTHYMYHISVGILFGICLIAAIVFHYIMLAPFKFSVAVCAEKRTKNIMQMTGAILILTAIFLAIFAL